MLVLFFQAANAGKVKNESKISDFILRTGVVKGIVVGIGHLEGS